MAENRGKVQGTDIPYVHSTTNNINVQGALKKANSTYNRWAPELQKCIVRIGKNREALNKSIKQRGEYLDFVDILNEVAHENNDEGIKAIVNFNQAAYQLKYAFNGNKEGISTWKKDTNDEDGTITLTYYNPTTEKQYQSMIKGLENFSKVLAYFKKREGWFANNSEELQKYMKDESGKIPALYEQAKQSFEKVAAAVKTIDNLVGTNVDKLFTVREDENGNITITSSPAFTNFLKEWWASKINPQSIGFEAEPLTNKLIEIVDGRIKEKVESEGIGAFKDLGDIAIKVKGNTYYASIKTNIENSTHRAVLTEDGWKTPREDGHAVKMSPGERYWLATLYTNSFSIIERSKNGEKDKSIMEESYYNLLLAYAIRTTTGKLAQEKNNICILIVNDTAIWYDEFLKSFWDDLMRIGKKSKKDLADKYLINPKDLFSTFAAKNDNQELYNKKILFLYDLKTKTKGKGSYQNVQAKAKRRLKKWNAEDTSPNNFEALFAAEEPITWVKARGLKHCLLATPNKV